MAKNNSSKRGFAAMSDDKQRDIASKGGKVSGGMSPESAARSVAGRKGAQAQSREAKAKGGRHSHQGNGG